MIPARRKKPSADTDSGKISPSRRVYRRAVERRGEIIAAAQTVFIRSNLQGARTRDIAEEAGVNEATLFKHFPSKEALFEAAVIKPLTEAMKGMHERIELYRAAQTPEEMGRLARSSTIRHLEEMERVLPLLTTALFSDQTLGRKLFREHLEPLIRLRGKVLRPLVRDGVDPEFVGLASFGMFFVVALERRYGKRRFDELAAIAVQFNRLLTGGFARTNGKGGKRRAT